MILARIRVTGVSALLTEWREVPAGIAGGEIAFEYQDPMWDSLEKTVVIEGVVTKDILKAGPIVEIPPECVARPGVRLRVGVFGTGTSPQIAIPTLWANLGRVQPAADPSGDSSTKKELPVWAQILALIGDLDDLATDAKATLVAAINEAATKGGGSVSEEEVWAIVDRYLQEHPPVFAETDPTVPSWAKKQKKPSYTAAEVGARPASWMPSASDVGADPAGTASAAVSGHNTAANAHSDIRLDLKAINDRLTAFFDSDDKTLDELSEIVSYITSNKSLIDAITTSKVSVSDIVDNLTTNVGHRPLSAAQGVVLKGLIDTVSRSLSNYQPKGDYLGREELPAAVNDALAQAKASGEFKGDPGAPGKDGAAGKDGSDGKTAYAYAKDGGYTGTEAQFAAKLAAELPTKLPNPFGLFINNRRYDGYAAVDMELQEQICDEKPGATLANNASVTSGSYSWVNYHAVKGYQEMTVIYDGVKYNAPITYGAESGDPSDPVDARYFYVGNVYNLAPEYPFSILGYAYQNNARITVGSGTHTMSVILEPFVKTIDKKFLPEDIVDVDWDIIPKESYTMDGGAYHSFGEGFPVLVSGKKYIVSIDGVEYERTAKYYDDGVWQFYYIGNIQFWEPSAPADANNDIFFLHGFDQGEYGGDFALYLKKSDYADKTIVFGVREKKEGGSSGGAVLYTEQTLTEEQKAQARTNIGAVSMEEVEELLGIEEEFSVSGEVVEFNVDVESDTKLQVISKIHRDSTWGLSDKLVLHQVSGTNFVDFSSWFGGVGKVISKNGLTATINADRTITIRGTNEHTDYTTILDNTIWSGDLAEKVYPAGTYSRMNDFMIQIRAAQYPNNNGIAGLTGNIGKKVTIPEPFRIVSAKYIVEPGATVDVTLPFGLFRGDTVPETDHAYSGIIHTVTFDRPVYEGEFNWATGELKDADGNTVGYYDAPEIKRLPGTNYFWTGFGENTVSNASNELGKVVLRLNETAPEDTIPSICDFMFTPTTPEAAYGLYYSPFFPNGGQFFGNEVPVLTTKGTLSVKDADGNVKYSKYVEPMFNTRGVSDVLTHKGLEKKWSGKFYLNKDPVSITEGSSKWGNDPVPYVFVWEFDESEFANTGIPAKIHDIPMASPCFVNNDGSENNVNTQVLWNGTPYPAFFSYSEETGKYILTARGIAGWNIKAHLTSYSKVHFYYQLETPYITPFTFAMGVDAGDTVVFEADLADNQPYIDALSDFRDKSVEPSIAVFVPRNAEDAMDGMTNAARMLNTADTAGGDATVQGYSWIGEGDGVTDYTVQIQSKIDELRTVSKGGTIHLGPGTYPISKSLNVYDSTTIIGCGVKTTIMQTADNTDAIVVNGSNITLKDFCIRLGGACTELTGCVYTNNNNPNGENGYPSNTYAQSLTIENVSMYGKYNFEYVDGRPILGDVYNNYKGVGIYSPSSLYFNYAHVDNVYFDGLMSGIYGGGGSNYFNVTSVSCKYGVYINYCVNSTFFVNGHSYYAIDENGEHISMSDAILYAESGNMNWYYLAGYDSQAFKTYAFFGPQSMNNKINIQNSYSTGDGSGTSQHEWGILKHYVVDYGRANLVCNAIKNTPFRIGSYTTSISKGPQFELSDPVIQNVLSGAGVWGNISSNTEFENKGIALRDVCRYPSEKTVLSNYLPYILSTVAPSVEKPIEIVIDYSNRPVIGIPNYFIQFHHLNVASDFVVSFDTTNTGVYSYEIPVTDNIDIVMVNNYPQIGTQYTTYRMKITFTKALQIANFKEAVHDDTFFDYNPDGLIGICNIGMTVNDYAGRSFLGECGGSLYGNVDMHQNTLKNLPNPVDAGDAVSKAYLEERLAALEALIKGS